MNTARRLSTLIGAAAAAATPVARGDVHVEISGFAYRPRDIRVPAGATVRWTNMDFIVHTVTSQTGPGTLVPSGLFDSGDMDFGEEFEFTFEEAGVYDYFCIPHGSSMQGMVRVTACYPDCDRSNGPGVLDIFDFLCFQNRFAAMEPYACDCDTSRGPGVCDIFDFLCFQNAYTRGCS